VADISQFEPIPELKGIFVARKGNLRCTAIALPKGKLCIYSPVSGLGTAARESLESIGKVTHLLAPNHYHNKALKEYHEAFPTAKMCASSAAIPRLVKLVGLKFKDLSMITSLLPAHLRLIEPDGLKTGEVWIRSKDRKQVVWFVVDAFSGHKMSAKVDRAKEISLLGTFPSFGIGDAGLYVPWLTKQLAADQPRLVIPCHGAIVDSADVSDDIRDLIQLKLKGLVKAR